MSMQQLPPLPDHAPGSSSGSPGGNDPGRRLRTRRALLAGAVVVALSGAGAATVWAATATPSPSPSATSSPSPSSNGSQKPAKGAQHLHSESVIKKADGTIQTLLAQRGTVESVSDTSITVKSEDGFSQQYAINGDTKITRLPAVGADGKVAKNPDGSRQKPSDIKASDLKSGDTVRIAGTKSGNSATAKRIVAGDLPTAGQGKGHGFGFGKEFGRGHHLDD